MAIFVYSMGSVFFGLGTALWFGWELSLVMFSLMPVSMLTMTMLNSVQQSKAGKALEAYGKAGSVAEEALSSIRTVAAFGGEKREGALYSEHLQRAQRNGVQIGLLTGVAKGSLAS